MHRHRHIREQRQRQKTHTHTHTHLYNRFVDNVGQRCDEVTAEDLGVEEDLRPQEPLVANVAAVGQVGWALDPLVALEVLEWLLVVLGKLLRQVWAHVGVPAGVEWRGWWVSCLVVCESEGERQRQGQKQRKRQRPTTLSLSFSLTHTHTHTYISLTLFATSRLSSGGTGSLRSRISCCMYCVMVLPASGMCLMALPMT